MAFGLWGPWDDQTAGSFSKLNGMTVLSGTGDDLETLDKTEFRLVFCTADSTGGSLEKDHTYAVDTAAEAFIDISSTGTHTHAGDTTGGGLESIFRDNPKFIDVFVAPHNITKTLWNETISGTGTTIDDVTSSIKSLKLLTGATSGSGATLSLNGFTLNFAKRSHFQVKLKMSATTALALKAGVNTETATASDDNTIKYEAQLCTVTNANWNLRTASGSNKSESNTGIAFTTSPVSIRLEHYPDIGTPKVDMYVDASAAFTKTSDIPVSGTTAATTLMKFSLKNSAAADKNCFVYGCRIRYYTTSDSWL